MTGVQTCALPILNWTTPVLIADLNRSSFFLFRRQLHRNSFSFFQDSKGELRLYFKEKGHLKLAKSKEGAEWTLYPNRRETGGSFIVKTSFVSEISPGRYWMVTGGNGEVVLRESEDGIIWGKEKLIKELRFGNKAVSSGFDTKFFSIRLVRDKQGNYIISYQQGYGVFYITSEDGVIWSDPIKVGMLKAGGAIIQDASGRYIALGSRLDNGIVYSLCPAGELNPVSVEKYQDHISGEFVDEKYWTTFLWTRRGGGELCIDGDEFWYSNQYGWLYYSPKLNPQRDDDDIIRYDKMMPAISPVRDIEIGRASGRERV